MELRSNSFPLDPLTPEEITLVGGILRHHVKDNRNNGNEGREESIIFRVITLQEPPKAEMMLYLDSIAAAGKDSAVMPPQRIAKVHAFVGKGKFCEFKVNLDIQKVVSEEVLPAGRHGHIDPEFMRKVELACLADAGVQKQIEALKLPEGATVIAEPWTYGTDGMNDMKNLVTMCWFYMRLSSDADANYYAYPLDLAVEMSHEFKVTKIFNLPSGEKDREFALDSERKPKKFDRRKVHTTSEYYPTLNTEQRTTTKPYQVVQPEGPSFKIQGHHIEWEKWSLHVGFNYREGMTLHDVRYGGRSLFYRLSLSEMFVPYGDPRAPYPRKAAFDVGNDGAGVCANNLKLGCDCLGHIAYFDAYMTTHDGTPLKMPNVICCHEIDDGILWKHTNTRTGNAAVTRSRLLVLQTIITVSNYEYIFLFYFGQDASITYEVRATGILSTAPIDMGDSVPYGTVVAPGVMAPYHQHLFCLRIDPAIDGWDNSLVVEESHPLPIDDPNVHNPFGVGYITKPTVVPHETGLDLDHRVNRVFKVVNENRINPTTGTPVGFKLLPCYSQVPLLAHPDKSFHARRSEFGAHAVWVTRYSDEEMFPSGKWTMQSEGGEGIASWIAGRRRGRGQDEGASEGDEEEKEEKKRGEQDKDESDHHPSAVRNRDIVVWHTFGSTHNPRAEDWPVMPCEKMVVGLKPLNFFERNPALDVPLSNQDANKSVLVTGGEDSGNGALPALACHKRE